MPNQVEISRSVNRGVGASNVTAGRVSRSRMSMNSEIPSLYWEGRNVTPQSLAKLVRIEERQKEIEGGHKSQERKKSATPPSNEVELPMTQVHVQEQRVKPINNPRNSGNNKQGGTSIVNREETLSTELNVNGITEFILTETKTVTLLNVRSSVVAKDSRQYDTVVLQGREYDKRKVAQLESDRLTSRATQTPITVQKDKEVMVMAVSKKDVACESSTCDMLELTKWVQDVAGNHHVDHSKLVCNQPHGGSYSYLPMHNKLPQYGPSKQSDDLIAMALTDMTECFLNISGSYAPPPIPQRSGDARGTKRYTYYPNVGGANRREGTRSQSHWGGQSSTSVSHTRRRSVASDNNNTSFSVASHPRGDNASAAVSATLSAMRDPIRNGLSLKEVVKRLYVKQAKTIMESFELLSALKIVERCMANRVFHRKQLLYCYAPLFGSATSFHGDGITSDAKNEFSLITSTKVKVEGGKSKQSSSGLGSAELSSSYRCNRAGKRGRLSLEKLWIHPYPFCSQQVSTKAMSLTALSFNPECKNDGDGIAAGYSIRALHNGVGVSGAVKEGGKVLFWSLRNPNQPERTINTPSGVLTLSFNPEQPQLLAIGMYNGDVQIYDLSAHDDDASILVADSRTSSGKHMDPVWQVKWVKSESGEIYFVSVSTDGRVVKWSLKKGLSYNPMMLLKRVGDAKGILSRQTGGISIDFLPGNSSQYIVSTEDGPIHHCSTSYSEQFLKTYGGPSGDDYGNDGGHNGPVYRVQCSPLLENRFVSCGADWTVKVWDLNKTEPLHTLQSAEYMAPIMDVAWSPTCSTMFASVAQDGRIELWDLEESHLDPVVRIFYTGNNNNNTSCSRPPHHVNNHHRKQQSSNSPEDQTLLTSPNFRDSTSSSENNNSHSDDNIDLKAVKEEAATVPIVVEEEDRSPHTMAMVAEKPSDAVPLTTIAFSTTVPVLAVGTSEGDILVYKIGVDIDGTQMS